MARGISQRLIKVGIPDQFIENAAPTQSLQAKYGLLSRDIVAKVRAALKPGSD
mgnify:CR=1 FL=1